MTDDNTDVPGVGHQEGSESELLLYDFFKHLTSLTLLTLGGVLAIAQAADKTDVKPTMLIIVLLVISAAGVCSFVGAGEIVRKRYTGSSSHNLEFYRKAAPALLSLGVGMFLGVYVDSLD